MSFANFGIGLGAFTQGLASGMQTGAQMRQMVDARDIRNVASEGIAGAREAREGEIDNRIERTGLDGRADFMGEVTTGYQVDGQSFDSPEAARGQAEQGVGSVMDFFMRDAAPRIADTYLEQGNVEKANAWQEFLQERNTQTGMRHWASALRSAQMGDMDGFATALEQAYNTPGYMDDGVTAKGHTVNEDGTITLAFERDGEEFSQTFQGTDDLVQAGIGLLSPQAAFEASLTQTQAAAEARADAATSERDFQRQLHRDTHRQGLSDRSYAQRQGQQEQRAVQTLRQWGYSEDEIREMVPRIIGASNTRAEISEADLRKSVMETLSRSDIRWRRMDNEEREQAIDEMVEVIRPSRQTQRPEAGGIGSAGTPVYDTQTGQIVIR